jgi:hypothetical protein
MQSIGFAFSEIGVRLYAFQISKNKSKNRVNETKDFAGYRVKKDTNLY